MNISLKSFLLSLFVVAIFLFSVSCKREPAYFGTHPDVIKKELAERRVKLAAMRKDRYELGATRASSETLVRSFLESIVAGKEKKARSLVFNETEYHDVLYPNLPEVFTMNYGMSPEAATKFAMLKQKMGLANLLVKLRGKKLKILGIKWKKDKGGAWGALNSKYIEYVKVRAGNRIRFIEEISVIVEHRGKYKIAVLTTD